MNTHFPQALVLAVATLLAPLAVAEKADRQQKMIIQADDLKADGLNQIQVYSGNVVVTKGTLILRGARLEIREDAQGYQYGTLTSDGAQLAFFRQKREGLDEFVEAQAQTIEYDGKADSIKLLQKAQLRRFRGATLADEYTGALITYNNTTDQYAVNGQVGASSAAKGAPSGRVRVVQTPAPAASAPVNKDTSVKPQLRPSPSLSGDKP